MTEQQIVLPGHSLLATVTTSPMDLIANAVTSGASIDVIERLMAMKERMDAIEARNAYTAAMAEFKRNMPNVYKNKHVAFGNTKYDHADLASVCDAVIPELSKYGLSHSWEPETTADGNIKVTCIITHVLGHSERAHMEAPPDTSGQKNAVQARASTSTYLARYTLLLRLGMAAKDMVDDDGRGGPGAFITEDQLAQIQDGLHKANADVAKFCGWLKVSALAEIPVKALPQVWEAINAKRKAHDLAQPSKGA